MDVDAVPDADPDVDPGARAVLVPLAVDPAAPPAGSRLEALAGTTMGTHWSARFALPPASAFSAADLQAALQEELDTVVAQMSHWAPDSLLSRYNRAPAGSWHDLPPAFFDVIDYALQVHAASGGAYRAISKGATRKPARRPGPLTSGPSTSSRSRSGSPRSAGRSPRTSA